MPAMYDAGEIIRALDVFLAPGQVTELRLLNAVLTGSGGRAFTYNGFFDDRALLVQALKQFSSWSGAYFTPNPLKPEILLRRRNRVDYSRLGDGATDRDVVSRRSLLVDLDPVRVKGISASDIEHEAAIALAHRIRDQLMAEGWPAPVLASSGNGAHLCWRIDWPVASDLPKQLLHALASRFDTDAVKVDRSVFNPARIWKLYGTLACKGDPSPERPHRMASCRRD